MKVVTQQQTFSKLTPHGGKVVGIDMV